MRLYGTCGHTFNWPDAQVHPETLNCSACGRGVAARWQRLEDHKGDATGEKSRAAARAAAEYHPLPKRVVPRVVRDPITSRVEWSIDTHRDSTGQSVLVWRWADETTASSWKAYPLDNGGIHHMPCASRVALWSNLYACPTEEIPDDGSEAPV